jgi:hypothetical protein
MGDTFFAVFSRKKKEGAKSPSPLFPVLLLLSLAEYLAIIGHASLAHPMGQTIRAAFGAGGNSGSFQLPVGAAPLVPSRLGDLTLRNRHVQTPPW